MHAPEDALLGVAPRKGNLFILSTWSADIDFQTSLETAFYVKNPLSKALVSVRESLQQQRGRWR